VLKGLDSDRKGILLQFLYASDLLQGDKPVVHLERVDLVGANLAGAFLAGANLAGAFLAGANLAGATLVRANLTGSILQAVDFGDTNLRGANLAGADLRKALHLTEEQVRGTIGSEGPNGTKLADGIPRPGAWKRNIDEQRRNTELYSALQVLWVDDNPTNNAQEIKIMNELGATITLARSTDEALDKVRHEQFDVIISDMGRREHGRDDYRAGYDLLEKLKEELMQDELKRRPRYIIYAGWNAPKQVEAEYHGAFGSTNIPQELLDLVRRPDPEPNTLEGGT
jgi:CheY-like chemotaxis protein